MSELPCAWCHSSNGHMHDCPTLQTKSPVLMMAENYYAVAAHLERQGNRMLEVSKMLAGFADQMCEDNIKNTPIPAVTVSEQSK